MLKNKKAQVTIFIIIAVLIVAGVVLFFVLKGGFGLEKEKTISPEVAPIKNFVDECLEESLTNVTYLVGEGGGYYFPPALSTKELGFAYHKKAEKSYIPEKEKIEAEISNYLSKELILCVDNFRDFQDYKITQGKITATTEILENSVKSNVKYPLTITKEDSTNRIKDFEFQFKNPFGKLYNAEEKFIEKELQSHLEGICITCLRDVALEENIYADTAYLGNNTYIFIFMDQEEYSEKGEDAFKYVFAIEY